MASSRKIEDAFRGLSLQGRAGPSTCSSSVEEPRRSDISQTITKEMRRTNKFPFLVHAPTVDYVKRSHVMFMMRGLPGSGKSTIVKLLKETYPNAVCCSADDYFLQPDGSYRFRQESLPDAHETCQLRARDACLRGCSVIVIDNTNIRRWEMQKYTQMAASYNYTVVTVEPRTSWKHDARELAQRNKHGVTEDILRKKIQVYEDCIPLYYGWFINQTYSSHVMQIGEEYFNLLSRKCPNFREALSQMRTTSGEPKMTSIYGREGSSTDTLHCTAFFSNRGRTLTSQAYLEQPHVKEALGRTFNLDIIGFVFTERTIGARVRLDPKFMPLWGKDDNEGMPSHGGRATASDRRSRGNAEDRNWRSSSNRPRRRLTDTSDSPSTSSSPVANRFDVLDMANANSSTSRFQPVVGDGSRAHVTLGYTKDSKAVQTGFDLQQVVFHEAWAIDSDSEKPDGVIYLNGAAIRCYHNAYWVVYLDEPISVPTLFSGRYC